MNVLYHHRTLGDGAEGIHVREIVAALRRLGHDVRVIGPTGEPDSGAAGSRSGMAAVKRALPGVVFELAEIAYSAYAFARTVLAIVGFRPTFIYDRYVTFNAGVVVAGTLMRVPVVLEVNAPLALERAEQPDEKLTFRRVAAAMEAWICRRACYVIAVSTPLKKYLLSLGVPEERCIVMPNGANPGRFRPVAGSETLRQTLGVPNESFVVGFTGVLREWHGLDLLVLAAARLRDAGVPVFLLIIGDGSYRPALETLLVRHGLVNDARITGRVDHAEVPRYIALFDAAVSPRATFYASPMKVMEYMALAKPVVVPDSENFLDFIDSSVGVTFKNGSSDSLCDALSWLYASRDGCREIGLAARRKVEAELNWESNARRVCELVSGFRSTGAEARRSGGRARNDE